MGGNGEDWEKRAQGGSPGQDLNKRKGQRNHRWFCLGRLKRTEREKQGHDQTHKGTPHDEGQKALDAVKNSSTEIGSHASH